MTIAEFYERYWQHPVGERHRTESLVYERKVLLQAALGDLSPEATVLDAGCGRGVFTAFLHTRGLQAVGIDLSGTAIALARQQYPKVHFAVTSVEEKFPFRDGQFDAIWCTEVLEHLFDVRATLAEFNRVLRPGGKLVLTTPYHGVMKNLLIVLLTFDQHYDPCGEHLRFFSRRSLQRCLEQVGFSVDRWAGVGRYWPVWMSQFVMARKTAHHIP
jgi:2-polyprenyl-3-methyl-5-hydroxy-6-metoxy-1,4-benzoquinol methylase